MRFRWRLRTLLIGIALVAIPLAAWSAIQRRADRFTHLAAYHLQAHEVLIDEAGGVLECLQVEDGETLDSAAEKRFAGRGQREFLAYKASIFHWKLFEKYQKAAANPWLGVEADPPPPKLANPRFNLSEHYAELVRDWDKPSAGGFQ